MESEKWTVVGLLASTDKRSEIKIAGGAIRAKQAGEIKSITWRSRMKNELVLIEKWGVYFYPIACVTE